jgi:hypothetical protein
VGKNTRSATECEEARLTKEAEIPAELADDVEEATVLRALSAPVRTPLILLNTPSKLACFLSKDRNLLIFQPRVF